MSVSISPGEVNAAVTDTESFLRAHPEIEAAIEEKFRELSAKDKCYSLLVLSLIAGAAALYGYIDHDTFLLASVGAFAAPLVGLLSKYCGRLRISVP